LRAEVITNPKDVYASMGAGLGRPECRVGLACRGRQAMCA
jgi:hypothetical protein